MPKYLHGIIQKTNLAICLTQAAMKRKDNCRFSVTSQKCLKCELFERCYQQSENKKTMKLLAAKFNKVY